MFEDFPLQTLPEAIQKKGKAIWNVFPEKAEVSFEEGRFVCSGCIACRRCCAPQPEGDAPYPMKLLDSQVSARTPNDFYLLNRHTALLDQRGCKSLSMKGCNLPLELRPMACGLFPFVLGNAKLLLYILCPAVLRRYKSVTSLSEEIFAHLSSFPRASLERISLPISKSLIGETFLDLGFPELF